MTLVAGHLVPPGRLLVVLPHSLAGIVKDAKVELRFGVTVLGERLQCRDEPNSVPLLERFSYFCQPAADGMAMAAMASAMGTTRVALRLTMC